MAEKKTKPTAKHPTAYIDRIPDTQVRNDCQEIAKLMET